MAFKPYAGTAGQLKVVDVAATLTTPMPTFSGTPAAIAGIRSWKITKTIEQPGLSHFGQVADSFGVLWEDQIQGGIGTWTAEIEGYFDGDTTASSALFDGAECVYCDFILSKDNTAGFKNCKGIVRAFNPETQVKGEPARFTCTIKGHEALPAFS